MRIQIFGLTFETPRVQFLLHDPWRATSLEHRIFENVRKAIKVTPDEDPEGLRITLDDQKLWKPAIQGVIRTLKAWQEEASPVIGEQRMWCFVVEGNVTSTGYDIHGNQACIHVYVRLGVVRGGPADGEKGEEIDLDGFNIQIEQLPES